MEQKAAQLADAYTNVLQLQARYAVLSQREQLKFATLDCLKIVAEDLPNPLTLQRFAFTEGNKLSLSGVCDPNQLGDILDQGKFYESVRFAKLNGLDMFDSPPLEQLYYGQSGGRESWRFALQLKNTEAKP